ncbi:MAG: phosphotransferase [Syntrophaceae bacterium]|nr:phosphotransferase [Syntrophaceae bacterium]
MPTRIQIPHGFALIQRGKASLLVREDYKDLLLRKRVEDFQNYLRADVRTFPPTFFHGRTPHPSIPIREGERVVIRQYVHGGLLRALTQNLYLLGSRSFEELAITEEIRSCGIPTLQPIAAIHQSVLGPLYRACLLTLELPDAVNLIQYLQQFGSHPSPQKLLLKRKMARSAGLLLQRFHRSGFFHGDLQLKNILVLGDEPLLIDFDRSYRKEVLSIKERMKNLLRLNRSVEKWRRMGVPISRTDRWRFFLAYAGEDRSIRTAMQTAIQTCAVRHLFHRCAWTIEDLVGSGQFGARGL